MITGLDDRDYGIYRDTVADYYKDLQYLAGRLDTERNWDYGEYRDQISDYYNDLQYLAGRYDSEYGKDWENISVRTWQPKSGRNSLDSSSPRRRRTRPDGKRKWHSRESSLSSRRRRRRKKDLVEAVDLEERHQRKRHLQREDMHRLPRN